VKLVATGAVAPVVRLRRHPAVVALTASVAVSQIGSQVTLLALPLLALLELDAGAAVVGLLTAASYLPWVVLALPVGVVVDRLPALGQRRVVVICDLVRAGLLALVPVLHATGRLTVPPLLAVVLVVGCATVLAEVTAAALVPRAVEAPLLSRVNGLLEGATALAIVGGPALAGALVAGVGAAPAVTADAVSFVASAALLARLPTRAGAAAPPRPAGERLRDALLGGAAVLRRDHVLARLCLWSTTSNLAGNALTPVVLTLLVRESHLSPALLGAALAVAALGGVAGALSSAPLAARLGHGRLLAGSAVVLAVGILAVGGMALAGPPQGVAAAGWVAAAYAVTLAGNLAGNAQVATVRQHRVQDGSLGRVVATWRCLGYAGIPVGAVAGGWLAQAIGLRPVVVGAAVVFALTCVLPVTRPVRELRLPG
jgi:MFS family permease